MFRSGTSMNEIADESLQTTFAGEFRYRFDPEAE